LLELFSKTFNRKFKTPYYVEEIINTFEYKNLVKYIRNIEINSSLMVNLKIKLIFILLFVHLKNDFKFTKTLISNDFLCNNLLERIQYRKIIMKKTIFNEQLNEKYKLKELIEKDNTLKEIILNDVCELMTLGIDYMSISVKSVLLLRKNLLEQTSMETEKQTSKIGIECMNI
jgi:activator of 2-hydroxyglutaryl-CoA dehydratase